VSFCQVNDLSHIFILALELLFSQDHDLYQIIALSLQISFSSLILSAIFAIPIAVWLVVAKPYGHGFWVMLLNSFMGLPPVVVGLFLFILCSRAGPLGELGLLFTPTIMVIAQTILIFPIIAAISYRIFHDAYQYYRPLLQSYHLSSMAQGKLLIYEMRYHLITALLAGLGRGIAEVGAIMIVGGNINHVTRVMTSTIVLESSRGNLPLALAMGLILILIFTTINALSLLLTHYLQRRHHGKQHHVRW
jgi:tungstate transport system permease protein